VRGDDVVPLDGWYWIIVGFELGGCPSALVYNNDSTGTAAGAPMRSDYCGPWPTTWPIGPANGAWRAWPPHSRNWPCASGVMATCYSAAPHSASSLEGFKSRPSPNISKKDT
jgi:hypothetical protein